MSSANDKIGETENTTGRLRTAVRFQEAALDERLGIVKWSGQLFLDPAKATLRPKEASEVGMK